MAATEIARRYVDLTFGQSRDLSAPIVKSSGSKITGLYSTKIYEYPVHRF
jgi:hypothetical protein